MTAEMFGRIPNARRRWRMRPALPAVILSAIVAAIALLFAYGTAEICEFGRWQLVAEEIGGTPEP